MVDLLSRALALTSLLILGDATSGQASEADAWPITAGAAAGYVPDQACAECHSGIWDSYQEVGMSQAFRRVRVPDMLENFEDAHFYHEASGNHYQMEVRGQEIFQRRYRTDRQGQSYAEMERKLDWVMGSGNHGRNYFYQTELGELYQLPLVWYADSGWGMAPGYDQHDHLGFGRLIDRQCMSCHNAYPDVASGSDLFGQPHLFPKALPEGLGCQRCHGPGAEHVRLAESEDATDEQLFAAITNPAKLQPAEREQLCHRCHLQPTTAIETFIQPFGVGDYVFRPGMRLQEALILVNSEEASTNKVRFEINHHGYRLADSRCYIESPGRLTCLTCHDPHRKVTPDRRAAHYRSKCLTCHEEDACSKKPEHVERAQVAADDCVACHMPKHRPREVVQVLMTDHLIRRELAPANWTEELAESRYPVIGSSLYRPGLLKDHPDQAVYSALAESKSGDHAAVMRLNARLEQEQDDHYEAWLSLGDKLFEVGEKEAALKAYLRTVALAPELPVARVRLGSTMGNLGQSEAALRVLAEALELNQDQPDAHLSMARILTELDRPEEALPHYRRVIKLRPHLFEPRLELANLQLQKGNLRKAVSGYKAARSADPRIPSAHDNLGLVFALQNKWAAALQAWERGLECAPDDVALLKRVAELRLTSASSALRSTEEASRLARRALELAPTDAEARLLFACTRLETKDFEQARRMSAATRINESQRACWLLLRAQIFARSGQRQMALQTIASADAKGCSDHPTSLHTFIAENYCRLPE